jgi:hypothetical protein
MSVPYAKIIAEVGVRINAVPGAIPSDLETNYVAGVVNNSSVFPPTAIGDAVITAEEKLATAIADTGGHPLRSYLQSVTDTLASGDDMPSVDASGVPIIGIYGAVYAASNPALICTEQPTEVIRRWQALSSYYKTPFYYFSRDGNGIIHTVPGGVKVQVCVYDANTQRGELAAGDILLADALEEAYVWGAVSTLVRDDEFMPQAAAYRGMFNDTLQAIRQGLTSIPSVTIAGPTQTAAVRT